MGISRRLVLKASAAATPLFSIGLPASAQTTLTVGLIPSEDSRAMIANSQAMMDMLSKALGMPVRPFVAADYNGVIEALREIFDPEIPVNIYDLGLIYGVEVDEKLMEKFFEAGTLTDEEHAEYQDLLEQRYR